jgi:hypothetical protein
MTLIGERTSEGKRKPAEVMSDSDEVPPIQPKASGSE